MFFYRFDRLIQKIPGIKNSYLNNYASIKDYFYKLNRKLHLVNSVTKLKGGTASE